MVKDPVCGKPDDTIDHMRGLMTELHVRYLPIMEDGRLLGSCRSTTWPERP